MPRLCYRQSSVTELLAETLNATDAFRAYAASSSSAPSGASGASAQGGAGRGSPRGGVGAAPGNPPVSEAQALHQAAELRMQNEEVVRTVQAAVVKRGLVERLLTATASATATDPCPQLAPLARVRARRRPSGPCALLTLKHPQRSAAHRNCINAKPPPHPAPRRLAPA